MGKRRKRPCRIRQPWPNLLLSGLFSALVALRILELHYVNSIKRLFIKIVEAKC